MNVIKQGQVMAIMYHPRELRSRLPMNQCYQRQMTCSRRQRRFYLCMVQTRGRNVSLSVVAQLRQMDSHNPPTGGECGLLEYDTVNVKFFFFSSGMIQFQPHTNHT